MCVTCYYWRYVDGCHWRWSVACDWRSTAKRQRSARSVDVKPVAAVQHSVGGGAGSVQTSSLKTATGTVSASSAVNRHKRPPPLHINISHSSALVSSFPRCSSNIATVIVYLYMPAIGFDFNSRGSEWPQLCWRAVKKLLTRPLQWIARLFCQYFTPKYSFNCVT